MKKNHHRFLINPNNIQSNLFESNDAGLINQIKNVFRLNIGSQINVFDGLDSEFLVEISNIEKNLIQGKVLAKNKTIKRGFQVGLFCSPLKGDHFEIILEKCTELGISFFQPVIFDHSIIREIRPAKLVRYKKIIKEAAEQSGRLDLPEILEPISFREMIKEVRGKLNLVAAIGAGKNILDTKSKSKDVNILVGPEGDFSDSEIEFIKKEDFLFFNLGNNILRSETACILATGIILQNMLK
ncbi:MAG: 16S rRNA (uracil(1498)-N(3))-methyltransferase [Patescibacteria group bacterium]|nr:16S rRNA (uracil(1498)-N(3))-methyltransferase [Patescibacteria group bacterium]